MADTARTSSAPKQNEGVDEMAPQSINVVAYARARAQEMEAMAKVSRKTWGNNKAMQTLPRHMRRRAASHNVKRLPRRLHEKGHREMNLARSSNPTTAKRPSRRHRRRHGNLLDEYSRRCQKNMWLETHIWHAKRFHMGTMWGYRIPLHPNDKGVRAAYRGAAHYCNMRDISFMCCIELKGIQTVLVSGLLRLCSVETGATPSAARYKNGNREGETIFFKHDKYPCGAIGPVKFLWKPLSSPHTTSSDGTSTEETDRYIWLWCHPAIYADVLSELIAVFSLEKLVKQETRDNNYQSRTPGDQTLAETIFHSESKNSTETKENLSGKKDVSEVRSSHFYAECYSSCDVSLTSLKDLLCRFSLRGPLSHSILEALLKVADVTIPTAVAEQKLCEESDISLQSQDSSNETQWWQEYYSCPEKKAILSRQSDLWNELRGLQSAAELAGNVVLGLTVRDPRIFLPRKKMRIADDPSDACENNVQAVETWPRDIACSPIWDAEVRKCVKDTKMTEADMNKLRAEHLVPGTQLNLAEKESRIPVLLIQHPGPQPIVGTRQECGVPLQWGAGWDLILPQSWSMAFWIGLIYRGARACGMKESLSMATEMGEVHFPDGFPDTSAGNLMECNQRKDLEAKYNRMPPAKRPNYIKLGTAAPFHYPWGQLVANWTSDDEADIVVLRKKFILQLLDQRCTVTYCQQRQRPGPLRKARKLSQRQTSVRDDKMEEYKEATLPFNAQLVAVRIRALHRGVLEPFSSICIPKLTDIETLYTEPKHGGPLEPPHVDPTTKIKKKSNKERLQEEMNKLNGGTTEIEKPPSCETEKTKGLCGEIADIRDSCSHPVIGQIKQGGYHFCEGRGAGIGFVVLEGLRSLLRNSTDYSKCIVLVRSPRSNQYRYAILSIIR